MQFADLPIDTIELALSYLDANCDRDTWARVGMALKNELGDAGFDVWDAWSRRGDNYDQRDARDTWRSIRATGGVTIATVIHMAKEQGYRPDAKPRTIDPAAAAARRAQREADQAREAAELERRQARAAEDATAIWNAAQPATTHPYLARKGITSPGKVRVGNYLRWFDGSTVEISGALLVPIRTPDGKIASVQAIFPDAGNALERDRDYLPGGRKQGCYFNIGMPTGEIGETVLIGEGYATCASAHMATDAMAVVAFDAGNLADVAQAIRTKLPHARIVMLADNDRWGRKNTGIEKAAEAARMVNGLVAIPKFASDDGQPTDFNDLHMREGLDAVRQQIHSATKPHDKSEQAKKNVRKADENEILQTAPPTDLPAELPNGFDLACVDWYSPFPDVNGKGKPLGTIENVAEACRRLGVVVRYNVIKKDNEYMIPGQAFSIDNRANASLAWLASACTRFGVPIGQLGDFLCYLADRNLYNPVANWITSKPWDGQSRLQDLYDTIQAEDDSLKEVLIKRWLVSAIAAAFTPEGISAHGVLVLQGDQYLGKTKWFKSLVPAELGVIQDGLMLRPDDRDSVKQVVSYWLVELGELDATFRKSDIAQLKSFLTRDRDVIRRAYAKMESEYARRTVFFASVNPREFLHDQTGNRRYWTIEAKWIEHSHKLDMQQVWAEVYQLWLKGEPFYLNEHEMAMLNKSNEEFSVVDPVQDRINTKLDWAAEERMWSWRSATDILNDVGIDRPSQSDATRAAAYIRTKNGNKGKRTVIGRVLWCPPKVSYLQQ